MTSTAYGGSGTASVTAPVLVGRTCAAEWTRLWTVKATWWFLAAAAVTMLGIGAALGAEVSNDPMSDVKPAAWGAGGITAMPAQFALLALALLAVTSDYATGGIVPTLQWTPRRGVLFVARVMVPVVVATTLGLLLAVGAGMAAWAASGGRLELPLGEGASTVGWIALVFALGTAMTVGLGLLCRNTAGGLISMFLLMLVLPLLLPILGFEVLGIDWMVTLSRYLPGTGAMNILLGEDIVDVSRAWSVGLLLTWSVAAIVLGGLRLMRADADR